MKARIALIGALLLAARASCFLNINPMASFPIDREKIALIEKAAQANQSPIPVPSSFGFVGIDNPDVTKALDKTFYWFFPSRSDPAKDPLVIWFTGGPGCSSELAIGRYTDFLSNFIVQENGPFTVNPSTGQAEVRQWSWNNNANLMFIDNPLGVGFSPCGSGNYAKTEQDIQNNFYLFLTRWMELPEFQRFKGHPLFITGESYAGHYVPYIGNKLFNSKNPNINLKGLAIGNGMSDPNTQYPQYIKYAEAKENLPYTKLTGQQIRSLNTISSLCANTCQARNPLMTISYEDICEIPSEVILTPTDPQTRMKFNVYNIKLPCPKQFPLCYDLQYISDFFNRQDVQSYLGVKKDWQPCDGPPGEALRAGDWWDIASGQLTPLLNSGINVLVYSGDLDYICNWMGGDAWTRKLSWAGKSAFNQAAWRDVGDNYGQARGDGPLQFMRVYNAGHLVPYDQPEGSVKMLNDFMKKSLGE